jgi:hypothetical protein
MSFRNASVMPVIGDLHSAWFKDSEGNTIAISTELPEVIRRAA